MRADLHLLQHGALLTRVMRETNCGASQLGALLEQAHARIAHVEAQCIEAALAKTHMETTAAALACEADRLSQEVSRATQPSRGCAVDHIHSVVNC